MGRFKEIRAMIRGGREREGGNWWRCGDVAGLLSWKGHNINKASFPEAHSGASPRTLQIWL
ncbi:MAG: hypothetical protein ABSG44_19135 [Thermodesulfobacteriota bacterium]